MMKSDERLGMKCPITRRDFINGVSAAAAGALLLPSLGLGQETTPAAESGVGAGFFPAAGAQSGGPRETYSPRKTGMRGSHPGSFEAGHHLRDNPKEPLKGEPVDTEYDLVVVGAGMSGLSAAYFFVKDVGREAKVLILDNHDDFGGHAKRNEVMVDGKMLVVNGGTLNIEAPTFYNEYAKDMLKDIGLDLTRYQKANETNRTLYRDLGLRSAYFFDKETWGKDVMVINDGGGEGRARSISKELLDKMPLSEKAKLDMLRLQDAKSAPDYFPELSEDDKRVKLARMSYQDYLLNVVKVDKQVLWFYQHFGEGNFRVGVDAPPALFAWEMGQHGFAGLKLSATPLGVLDELPGTQHGRQNSNRGGSVHFPDGNATIARSLVRWLIPAGIGGSLQEELGTAKVNYDQIDLPTHPVRLRLSSTVLNVKNIGPKDRETGTAVTYSKGGKLYEVKSKAVVMACWNMIIPYIIPDLPKEQKDALAYAVKGPLMYTSVAVRNWKAWKTAGVSNINASSMYFPSVALTEAVSLGDMHHAQTPDEPIFLHLSKIFTKPGMPRKDQHRMGRYEVLNTSFETMERNLRDQLDRMLGPFGFDSKRDIASIVMNRWPHGYAYTYSGLSEPLEWVYTNSPNSPCVIARKPFGLISIANSDAGASPHTDTAIFQGHRAVDEVVNRRAMPHLG